MCLQYVKELQSLQNTFEMVELFGDNETSIHAINQPDDTELKKNLDFILEIQSLRSLLQHEVHTTYVRAHQDKHEDVASLPPEVQAHVRCDHRASSYVKKCFSLELLPRPLSNQKVLFSNTRIIPLSPYQYLISSRYLNYAQRKLGLTAELLWSVDWEMFQLSSKRVSPRNYIIFQKILWSFKPT